MMMRISKNKYFGSLRSLLLLGLLFASGMALANAQTKELTSEEAPRDVEVVSRSTDLAAIDPGTGFQPFQTSVNFNQAPLSNASLVDVATVPAGKRLVIEFVSVNAQIPAGQRMTGISLMAPRQFYLLVNEQPPSAGGDAIFRAVQQLRLYASSGSTVQIGVFRSGNSGTGQFQVALSGYFEDAP